ncbi:phosphatidate cytidylyltransferase [Rhodoferax saidenbachensis]|uniref:Phosphatidate cytidylyltransferase n=1 Tax=Rhodoferax saidenbachensis TaxID=1484693 RepID=A0ABU1ZM57_9BURK|nr:phosphatidate cytidylyltransferase [Rhodoferax saidenbachensis]MDR7306621.1 phosphatidate cytidylyltransferase [Rhodoferax saidenbachensis]
MLKQRVITAILLLAILLPAVFYPNPLAFQVVALLLIGAGGWEWARLNQYGDVWAWGTGLLCAALCCLFLGSGLVSLPLRELWLAVGAVWVLGGSWLLFRGVGTWRTIPRPVRWCVGVSALCAAWLAVAQARSLGNNFLFSVLVLVWVADVFAYFSGRLLGGRLFKRKLAPSISPGKTWEGVAGGAVGVLICAFAWQWVERFLGSTTSSIYRQMSDISPVMAVLAVVFLVAWSVVGDLLESLIKRSAGAKDSSHLLPGHGGVLDRLDALLPVIPLAMMLHTL